MAGRDRLAMWEDNLWAVRVCVCVCVCARARSCVRDKKILLQFDDNRIIDCDSGSALQSNSNWCSVTAIVGMIVTVHGIIDVYMYLCI